MKKETTLKTPNSTILFLLMLFFSFQGFSQSDDQQSEERWFCGDIENFQFSNGDQSLYIENGEEYNIGDLPTNFYVDLNVDGRSQSVKYYVENLDTGERYNITENILPYTFPAGNEPWNLGAGNFKVRATLYRFDNGFGRCDRDIVTFTLNETCEANAGTLTADMDTAELVNGMATISATPDGNSNVPDGYETLFVLTRGASLVIVDVNTDPVFEVSEAGGYTIHTLIYNPETLDLSVVVLGQTTGVDVLNIINDNGICASLDVPGAKVSVMECMADAGTLTADMDTAELVNGMATISATPDGNSNVPDGYETLFVLTRGASLVIVDVNTDPVFEVSEAGGYTIHTLIYNPETLDLSVVVPGQTTGVDVLNIINDNGICASLDVPGAKVSVLEEAECVADAGTMYSSSPITCLSSGSAMLEATQNNPANIPDGYEQLFVLTEAFTLTILNVSPTPEFTVSDRGFYRIHSLVYNPMTLDLSVVVPGQTTGFDVVNLINDNNICASLDVHGAINLVIGRNWFCFFFENYHKGTNANDSGLTAYVDNYDNYKSFEKDFIANNSEISLYPNPVVSDLNVNIQLFDDEVMSYRVNDVSGRQVLSGTDLRFTSGSVKLNTNNLTNGMYIISFESEYRTITKKIMVNR